MSCICCSVGSMPASLIRIIMEMGQARLSAPKNRVVQAQMVILLEQNRPSAPAMNPQRAMVADTDMSPTTIHRPIVSTRLPKSALRYRTHISRVSCREKIGEVAVSPVEHAKSTEIAWNVNPK